MLTMHRITGFFILVSCAGTPSLFIIKSIQDVLCVFIASTMSEPNFFALGVKFLIGCGFKPAIIISIPITAGLKQVFKESHNIPPI